MKKMDALFKYWEDPNYVVLEAGQPEKTIDWLSQQTPDTWHRVVMTWNYDYEDIVLSWVLQQENCDKGTAARVFDIEGMGHWLGNAELAKNESHLCSIILKNWKRYKSGDFLHTPQNYNLLLEKVRMHMESGLYADTPILDVAQYSGSRDAQSEFESQDGKIVVAFDHWLRTNGIELTE